MFTTRLFCFEIDLIIDCVLFCLTLMNCSFSKIYYPLKTFWGSFFSIAARRYDIMNFSEIEGSFSSANVFGPVYLTEPLIKLTSVSGTCSFFVPKDKRIKLR